MTPTPGRPFGRSGVVLLAVVLAACDGVAGGSSVQLDDAEVSITGSAHEVRFAGSAATDSISPARIEAAPGDAVRFVSGDRRAHAPTFDPGSLDPAVRAYLDGTGQLRGPPLVDEGAAWVVLLEDAPPGRYPFGCRAHDGGEGVLVVEAAD